MSHSVNVKFLVPTALCFAGVLSASYAVELGRGRIESMVSVKADYDSNIFLNENEVEDFIFSGSGTVSYIRDVALVSTELAGGARASLFADHSEQDSFDPFANGYLVFTPSEKTTVKGRASYERMTTANEALNDLVESDDITLDGSLQSLFSEKLGYRISGGYRLNDYKNAGYADVFSYSAGLDGVYIYSPKLTMLAGYNYRESWTDNRVLGAGDPSSEDSRFSVGLEGELAPKVSGHLSVGIVERNFDSGAYDDSSGLFASSGLKWIVSPKTTATITVLQDFDTTAANQSSKNSSLLLGLTQVLNDRWTLDGTVGYTHAKYEGALNLNNRTDDIYRAKVRANYAFASNMMLEFSLGYSDSDSTNPFSTYDRVVTGVGLNATF